MKQIVFIAAVALVVSVACGNGNVFELKVGECFDDPQEFGNITDVEMVECDQPHDNEVIALFDLPDGSFPGVSAVEGAALEGCYDAFEPYVGRDYESSVLDFSWLVPTPQSWDEGDREVVCIAYDFDLKKLNGSVKDSGI